MLLCLKLILSGVTHKSTVARTIMCRQDGRGWFPILLDDLSKCRHTHKENPNLVRIFYMTFTLNDIYKQYNKLHKHWYTKISSLRCAEDGNPPQKCIRLVYEMQVIYRALQALYSPQRCELIKKTHTHTKKKQNKKKKKKHTHKKTTTLNCSYRIFIIWRSPVSPVFLGPDSSVLTLG